MKDEKKQTKDKKLRNKQTNNKNIARTNSGIISII